MSQAPSYQGLADFKGRLTLGSIKVLHYDSMQDVSSKMEMARVLVFEPSAERAAMITDRFQDHGIDAVFVDKLTDIIASLRERRCHVILLNDGLSESREILSICAELQSVGTQIPDIILASDNKRITLRECHEVGCAHLVKRALDFNELCDLIERMAQISGKRLYDGSQICHTKRFGPLNRGASRSKNIQELNLEVSDIARGGFYFESNVTSDFVPSEGLLVHFEVSLPMLPNYSFQGKGYVSWVRKLANGKLGIGIEFALIPAESEHLLKSFSDLFKIREFIPVCGAPELANLVAA